MSDEAENNLISIGTATQIQAVLSDAAIAIALKAYQNVQGGSNQVAVRKGDETFYMMILMLISQLIKNNELIHLLRLRR